MFLVFMAEPVHCKEQNLSVIPLEKFTHISRMQLWLNIFRDLMLNITPTVYEKQEILSHYFVFMLGWERTLAWQETHFTKIGSEWLILDVCKSKWCCAWAVVVYIIVQAPSCKTGYSLHFSLQEPKEWLT